MVSYLSPCYSCFLFLLFPGVPLAVWVVVVVMMGVVVGRGEAGVRGGVSRLELTGRSCRRAAAAAAAPFPPPRENMQAFLVTHSLASHAVTRRALTHSLTHSTQCTASGRGAELEGACHPLSPNSRGQVRILPRGFDRQGEEPIKEQVLATQLC